MPDEAPSPARLLWPYSLAVGLLALAVLVPSLGDYGATWDEPVYMLAAWRGEQWFGDVLSGSAAKGPLSRESLHYHWPYAQFGIVFHPPGAGYPGMVTRWLTRGWLTELAGYRLATVLQVALLAGVLFHFLARRLSVTAGLVGAVALVSTPRLFAHAHLFATDVPSMFWWGIAAMLFYRAVLEPRTVEATHWARLGLAASLAMGFLVKPIAVLVLLPMVAAAFADQCRSLSRSVLLGWLRGALLAGLLAAPLLIALSLMLSLSAQMQAHTQQQIIRGMNRELAANADLTRDQKSDLIRDEVNRWITHVDLMQPGVESPGYGPALLLLPLVLWMLRGLWCRFGQPPRWLRPQSNLGEAVFAVTALTPAVVLLLAPCWWRDTLVRMAHYLALNTQRRGALPDIEILYLGEKYVYSLPWHNGWVLLAATVPLGILALALLGMWPAARACFDMLRQQPLPGPDQPLPRLSLFLAANAVTLPVLRMLETPAHDGIRLMLPALFFLAALAGLGVQVATQWFARSDKRFLHALPAGIAALLLLPGVWGTFHTHPYQLSYYNALVGGLPGAQQKGFEVTYWYDAVGPSALQKIDRTLPAGSTLLHHQQVDVFSLWVSSGQLQDVSTGEKLPPAQTYIGLLSQGSKSMPNMRVLSAMRPELVAAELDGVPLYAVYSSRSAAIATALFVLTGGKLESLADDGPRMDRATVSREIMDAIYKYPGQVRSAAGPLEELITADNPSQVEIPNTPVLTALVGARGERLGYLRDTLRPQLEAWPNTLNAALDILARQPERVSRLITSAGYPPIGEYLD